MNKRKIAILLAIVTMITPVISMASSSDNKVENNTLVQENEPQYSDYQFIALLGKEARRIGQENNIYASVMIAQGCLETGYGKSGLSNAPDYNIFGIKGDYKGKSADYETWEDYGGNIVDITDTFRSYPSFKESMEDYAQTLVKGTKYDSNYYSSCWKSNAKTYEEATASLTGKYATDRSYNEKLNKIIEKYNLTKYDTPVNYRVERENEETISTVSQSFNISIESLKELNPNIEDINSFLNLGQNIILQKEYYTEDFNIPIKIEYNILNDYGNTKEGFSGIDFEVMEKAYIYPTNNGTIVEIGEDEVNGKYIVIQHENGIYSNYSNLDEVNVEKDENVNVYKAIGSVEINKNTNKSKFRFSMSTGIKSSFQNPKLFLEY